MTFGLPLQLRQFGVMTRQFDAVPMERQRLLADGAIPRTNGRSPTLGGEFRTSCRLLNGLSTAETVCDVTIPRNRSVTFQLQHMATALVLTGIKKPLQAQQAAQREERRQDPNSLHHPKPHQR